MFTKHPSTLGTRCWSLRCSSYSVCWPRARHSCRPRTSLRWRSRWWDDFISGPGGPPMGGCPGSSYSTIDLLLLFLIIIIMLYIIYISCIILLFYDTIRLNWIIIYFSIIAEAPFGISYQSATPDSCHPLGYEQTPAASLAQCLGAWAEGSSRFSPLWLRATRTYRFLLVGECWLGFWGYNWYNLWLTLQNRSFQKSWGFSWKDICKWWIFHSYVTGYVRLLETSLDGLQPYIDILGSICCFTFRTQRVYPGVPSRLTLLDF